MITACSNRLVELTLADDGHFAVIFKSLDGDDAAEKRAEVLVTSR